jgi:hypothetical protein
MLLLDEQTRDMFVEVSNPNVTVHTDTSDLLITKNQDSLPNTAEPEKKQRKNEPQSSLTIEFTRFTSVDMETEWKQKLVPCTPGLF